MAKIVGAITTSHVPAIGRAIAKGLQNDPYWKPFFDGFPPVREWLAHGKAGPDMKWPVRTVPVCVNTVQGPLPSAARCYRAGQAIARAIAAWPGGERVVVMGTGGLSHQLDGERAGFINKDFVLHFMESMATH